MSGHSRIGSSTIALSRIKYISDVLFLKIVDGEVVDIDDDDIQQVLIHLDEMF